MIRFKEHLLIEELKLIFGSKIYKNPTTEEMQEIKPWARAVGTTTGNIYVAKLTTSKSFHAEILTRITSQKGWGIRGKIITLQRIGNKKWFALGETEDGITSFVKSTLKNVSRNQKHLKFTLNNILAYDLPTNLSGWDSLSFDQETQTAKEMAGF